MSQKLVKVTDQGFRERLDSIWGPLLDRALPWSVNSLGGWNSPWTHILWTGSEVRAFACGGECYSGVKRSIRSSPDSSECSLAADFPHALLDAVSARPDDGLMDAIRRK
ncbi:unnamed protein product [Caretta caretta]